MDYWKECVEEAFEDAGIKATQEQIDTVISWVEGAHDNYGMAHGHEHITSPLVYENEKLTRELEKERNKITCRHCKGSGVEVCHGPVHSSRGQCFWCNGEGRVIP